MKIKLDYGYMKKIKYVTLCFVILYLIYLFISHFTLVYANVRHAFSFFVKITSPFLWGMVIAYMLNPMSESFEKLFGRIRILKSRSQVYEIKRKRIIRGVSITLSIMVVVSVVVFAVYSAYVMINGSFKNFKINSFFETTTAYLNSYSDELKNIDQKLLKLNISSNVLDYINTTINGITTDFQGVVSGIAGKIATIGRYIVDISFGFVFAVSFMMNREFFGRILDNGFKLIVTKEEYRKSSKGLLQEIDQLFMNFIRGQLIDLGLVSTITIIALVIVKFKFAFLVGLFSGIANIIPYLGTWLGIIPAMIIGLVNGGWQEALFVGIYIVVIQQVYYVLISPRVQGKSIGMHPVFILLSVFVFGNIFGLIGIVLAIPFGGMVQIFILRWAKKRAQAKGISLTRETPDKL